MKENSGCLGSIGFIIFVIILYFIIPNVLQESKDNYNDQVNKLVIRKTKLYKTTEDLKRSGVIKTLKAKSEVQLINIIPSGDSNYRCVLINEDTGFVKISDLEDIQISKQEYFYQNYQFVNKKLITWAIIVGVLALIAAFPLFKKDT